MEASDRSCFRVCIWVLCFAITACDARKSMGLVEAPKHGTMQQSKKLELISTIMSLVVDQPTDTSNTSPYGVSSPFSLPPFDSLAPNSLPENAPPYCFNPPLTPQTPSTAPIGTSPAPPTPVAYNIPSVLPGPNPPMSPTGIIPSPPGFSWTPYPPQAVPGPPSYIPGGPSTVPSPYQPILSPPCYKPSPPRAIGSPPFYIPSPPVFLPPIVYPPPTGPPSPSTAPITALWCVAKPSVPDPIIQEAMNYACGSGANCDSIQPNRPCFEPNALFAHASYAFNSYFQRTKRAGGTCDFGGTAILVTVDPSSDGCHFEYS